MSGSNVYYMLISSLPSLPAHFTDVEQMPISPIQFRERLDLLKEEDRQIIHHVANFLLWDRQQPETTDNDVIKRYQNLMEETENDLVKQVIEFRFNLRTIVSALRCRRKKMDPPPNVSPIADQIRRNWKDPVFRLGSRYPWVNTLEQVLNGNQPFEMEKHLININWQEWSRLANNYHFSFEAVILYQVRLEMIYRWTARNAEAGLEKFNELVRQGMGEYANLYE